MNQEKTRTLLGIEFIKNAGIILDPANGKWSFNDQCDKSFDLIPEQPLNLVNLVSHEQVSERNEVLRQADPKLPYLLRTDASAYAIGAALLQGEGADERPIEYASRLLTQAERNYATTEREALARVLYTSRGRQEQIQDRNKQYCDQFRRATTFNVGDQVLVNVHALSNSRTAYTSKFAPKRDGPYLIMKQCSPTTFELSSLAEPDKIIGKYHSSCLKPFKSNTEDLSSLEPLRPIRGRGRPRKHNSLTQQSEIPEEERDCEETPIHEDLDPVPDPTPSTSKRGRQIRKIRVCQCCQ